MSRRAVLTAVGWLGLVLAIIGAFLIAMTQAETERCRDLATRDCLMRDDEATERRGLAWGVPLIVAGLALAGGSAYGFSRLDPARPSPPEPTPPATSTPAAPPPEHVHPSAATPSAARPGLTWWQVVWAVVVGNFLTWLLLALFWVLFLGAALRAAF